VGVKKITLDSTLMHWVDIEVHLPRISNENRKSCKTTSKHLRLDGSGLHLKGRDGTEMVVGPWYYRGQLVHNLVVQIK
jgi:hypothetical protein